MSKEELEAAAEKRRKEKEKAARAVTQFCFQCPGEWRRGLRGRDVVM